jgi:hypothetical protein
MPDTMLERHTLRRVEHLPPAATTAPSKRTPAVMVLAGLVFLAMILVHSQLRSGAPSATDPGGDVLAYLTRHHDRLQFDAVVLAFAMAPALVWLAGLVRVLRRGAATPPLTVSVAFGGGVLAAAGAVTAALTLGTIVARTAELGPAAARVWWTLFLFATGAIVLGLGIMIGATVVHWLRDPGVPRGLVAAGALLTLLSAAGACAIGYGSDAVQTVAGIAVLLDSIWLPVAGAVLWRAR